MRKPTFCICENKGADQLRGYREADQRLCFRYIDSTIPLLSKSDISSFCSCTAWFVSYQVGNQNICFLMTRLRCRLSIDLFWNLNLVEFIAHSSRYGILTDNDRNLFYSP